MKTLLAVGAVVGVLAIVAFGSYVTNYNYGNRAEKTIVAEYTNMENVLSSYTLKVQEAAQIPTMYKDDVKEIVSEIMDGRYGEGGSKAMFQWIQEKNPSVDASVYKELQLIISSGRDKFENAQTKFIDTKRTYETNLGYLFKGFWLNLAGYPKIDLDEYVIISNSQTKETFETKIDNGVNLLNGR